MRFWDGSGVASLILDDALSERARSLVREDPHMLVWWGTEIEATSAVFRAVRSARLSASHAPAALGKLTSMAESWREVPPDSQIRREARRVLGIHSLRTGDALQLAAAL